MHFGEPLPRYRRYLNRWPDIKFSMSHWHPMVLSRYPTDESKSDPSILCHRQSHWGGDDAVLPKITPISWGNPLKFVLVEENLCKQNLDIKTKEFFMSKSSISFRVPRALWNRFKEQTDALFLSRAPFLDHVLQVELQQLTNDLDGVKLSTRTKRYIANTLCNFDRDSVSVNIEVSADTANKLKAVMAKHNLVRDAFMSRLIVFLRAKKAILDELEVPSHLTSAGNWAKAGLPDMPTSPMRAMEEVLEDPLYYLRAYVRHRWGQGLYTIELSPGYDWLACVLSPERVKGTPAQRRLAKQNAELSRLMEKHLPDAVRSVQEVQS